LGDLVITFFIYIVHLVCNPTEFSKNSDL